MASTSWWIVYKSGTKTNPAVVSTPSTGAQATSLEHGNPTVINGVSYTITTAGGPYSSKADAQAGLKRITANAGGPVPIQETGWIVVPEGSVGNVVNYLSKIGNALKNPTSVSSDITALSATLAADSGNPSTVWTVQELKTGGQVQAAKDAGITVYGTQAEAQAAADQKNKSGGGWEQAITNFFTALGDRNTWVRIVKIVVGGSLLIIGVSHLTGIDNAVGNLARKVPAPF